MERRIGIVAFAFGVPHTIPANRRIAAIAQKYSLRYGASVYTQPDVFIDNLRMGVEYIKEKSGNPSPTLRIARGAVRWALRRGIGFLWVAAADPHLDRCIRDLQYAILEAKARISIFVCGECFYDEEWFCLDSTQKRTQTKEAWERRERIIQLMPMWLYRFVAS